MSKGRPSTVYSVDGHIVIARHPKGALGVVRARGLAIADRPTIAELPPDDAGKAINAKQPKHRRTAA